MDDNSREDREALAKIYQNNPYIEEGEFDEIVGDPISLKPGDFVKVEGIVFEISAIFPLTKSGKRTIKLKPPIFEALKPSFEPIPNPPNHDCSDRCPKTPTWMRTGRHG